ncbi:MAG: hypothetical protein IJX80_00895 [Clostridia bacterium]|nr:hypothetical protein [Clostridia bacterium]
MKKRLLCLLMCLLMVCFCACGAGTEEGVTADSTSQPDGTSAPEESSTPEVSSTPEESSVPEETSNPEETTTPEPVYDTPPTPPAAEDYDGFSFDANGICEVGRSYAQAPYTISVWLRLDANFDDRAGAILSNSDQSRKNCISFEIHKNGNPYLCYLDKTYVEHRILFEDVDVRTGEWLYLTVVLNIEAGYARCYVNGVLEQQMNESPNGMPFQAYGQSVTLIPFTVGGDRQDDNPRFFAGEIKELALFSDVRTTAELRNDYTNGIGDGDENLIALYDLRGKEAFGTVTDMSGNGYDFVCSRDFYDASQAYTGEYAYSFAVVGDTQTLAFYGGNDDYTGRRAAYRDSLPNLYKWIVDNVEAKNIQYVFGMGDITEKDTDPEWVYAKDAITQMDGVVPYSLLWGMNHDTPAQLDHYFATHETYANQIRGYYRESSIANCYQELTVGEIDYLILCLDFGMKDDVIAWASGVIEAHPEHRVIITTHAYLEKDGSLLETGEDYAPSASYYDPTNNDGDDIWEKLVSKHENIYMIMSGHMSAETVVISTQTGDHGNEVIQVLVDPQTMDGDFKDGGTGMVAMFYFSEEGDIVAVEYYSTVRDGYKPLQLFGAE